ncbi:conserved hypothetical protein [Nannocystis exedens]|uniref:DUF4440 domain-containing protein n=1 Tax=Nannocystis exedens TaxID=54 RepID=A0A1I1V521_9BACT|nr:DUF4440 domain-containing protein [Nannocystis exedens]PCC72354.1 hypothetical protein NAEX_05434 [Nannocystis exedens]SFD78127.1 conserved hypothetical protein [Nannocystis exedens]
MLLLGLLAGGCGFTSEDRRAIEGVLGEQAAAWNHGDLEGFLRAYEPSDALVFTSGGAIRRGFVAARARYLERYGARGAESMGHLEFEIVDVRGLGRDAAVVLGRWRLTQTEAAGAGVFTLVFRRDARGWSIVHDHTSVDRTDPPPATSADPSASTSSRKQSDTDSRPEL